uniref:Uncharacterized protein n=1 Tax=Arundo donax TaxID=35708 RepID=A0A0A8ZBN9_ARUDO
MASSVPTETNNRILPKEDVNTKDLQLQQRASDSTIIWRPPLDYPDAKPGISAKFEEADGADFIVLHISWKFRMAG